MKFSFNWLREFVPFGQDPHELADLLTRIGHNVDSVTKVQGEWQRVVIGKVISCEPMTGTDHLSRCKVVVGDDEMVEVVCGAPNVREGQIVPVALVGAVLPGGLTIGERKVKGVLSHGMICSERELGLSAEGAGILVLRELSAKPQFGEGDLTLGDPLEKHLGVEDWIYDVEITINRGDCLSHLGLSREIAAATGLTVTPPRHQPSEVSELTSSRVSVEIRSPDRCPRYSARMVTGVNLAPSPLWMQERLRRLGVRTISNVVDATNYVMLEMGHPLHAFDYRLVNEGKIIVRNANANERFTTLDGKEYALGVNDFLIADPRGGIALAGIMGGLNSEIKSDTRDVLIECAYFERVGIRFTSRDLGISSESSHRFERGVDPEMTPIAISRCAFLIQELSGGQVLNGIVDAYPNKWQSVAIGLRPSRVNDILGTKILAEEISRHLSALQCKVTGTDSLTIQPPSWRHDLEREIDLIEEIARLHGYDRIETAPSSRVPLASHPDQERRQRLVQQIKGSLVELGFQEAITLSLVSPQDVAGLQSSDGFLKISYPISEDLSVLRPTLAITLLAAARRNLRAGLEDIRLFEWGNCFERVGDEVRERVSLGGILIGNIRPENWGDSTREVNFYDLKGIAGQFLQKIALDNAANIYYDIPAIIRPGLGMAIREPQGGAPIGWLGQLEPPLAARFDVEKPVWYFEFDGEQLFKYARVASRYQSMARYPAARRDLSFIAPTGILAAELDQIVRTAGGPLLEVLDLFDLYEGKNTPSGMKSLSYHLTFRSAEQTLSDETVDEAVANIVAASGKAGITLRSN